MSKKVLKLTTSEILEIKKSIKLLVLYRFFINFFLGSLGFIPFLFKKDLTLLYIAIFLLIVILLFKTISNYMSLIQPITSTYTFEENTLTIMNNSKLLFKSAIEKIKIRENEGTFTLISIGYDITLPNILKFKDDLISIITTENNSD